MKITRSPASPRGAVRAMRPVLPSAVLRPSNGLAGDLDRLPPELDVEADVDAQSDHERRDRSSRSSLS